MTKKAIQLRKIRRKAAYGTINKVNGHYYYMDKIDYRIYRFSNNILSKCNRLEEPKIETYAIPDDKPLIRWSSWFDPETNTFNLTEIK